MSRVILDSDLRSWEVYPSGGRFGLPEEPKVVFHCLSDLRLRSRYIRWQDDNAAAEQAVRTMSDEELRALLAETRELD